MRKETSSRPFSPFYDLFFRHVCRHSRLGEGLAVLDLLETVLLEANGLDLDETGGVHGGEALEGVHGGIGLGVEVAGIGLAAEDVGVTLVGHHADLTSNVLLGEDDGVLDAVGGYRLVIARLASVSVESNLQLALRAEVHAVVQLTRPRDGDELITELTDLGIHNKTLCRTRG